MSPRPVRRGGVTPLVRRLHVSTRHRRGISNAIMIALTYLAAGLATLPLVFILFHLLKVGAASISADFFTKMPKPVGEPGGGMGNAIVGTTILISVAAVIGLPIGIGAGLFLADQRGTKLANAVRFLSDVLNGLPSIVIRNFRVAWSGTPVRPFLRSRRRGRARR